MCPVRVARVTGRAALFAAALVLAALALPTGAAQSVQILAPAAETTLHDNSGNVAVAVALDSDLTAGQALQPLVDNRPHGPARQSREFVLEGLDRGEHTLQVQLLDAGGRVVAVSAPVRFYQWQASRLFPSRR